MKIDYIVIAGSSGGHILPSISLINQLAKLKKKIVFITNSAGQNYIRLITNSNCEIRIFNQTSKLNLFLAQFIFLSKTLIINNQIKVIGFGGYLSVLPICLSKGFNIFLKKNKTYIHEQNFIYGLANKINYLFSNFSFISFPKAGLKSKEIYVGNFFKKVLHTNGKPQVGKNKILLIGGSAGSIELNNQLINYIKKIPIKEIDKFEFNIQIPSSQTSIKDQYKKLCKNINFFDFIDDLKFYDYNLIFSRCGSGSMFEILYYTDKVFFVPHLHSRDLHQKFNKMFFINKLKIKDEIPNHDNLKILPNFYFNQFINPYSIHKISSFISN
jgi:UDP-N-acetylglucosamine:LPS N-acetylglucosamine transferase